MMTVDEIVQVELFQVEMLKRLGVDHDLAVELVDNHVDWHEVDRLVRAGCSLTMAIDIAR